MLVISQSYNCATNWRKDLHTALYPCHSTSVIAFAEVISSLPQRHLECRKRLWQPNSWENWEGFSHTSFLDGASFSSGLLEEGDAGAHSGLPHPHQDCVTFQLLQGSDSKVCSQRSYVLHLSLPEKVWLEDLERGDLIPTQPWGFPRVVSNQHGERKCVTLPSLLRLDVSHEATRGSLDFCLQSPCLISAAMSPCRSWLIQQGCGSKEHRQRLGKFRAIFRAWGSWTVGSHSLEKVLDREWAVQEA